MEYSVPPFAQEGGSSLFIPYRTAIGGTVAIHCRVKGKLTIKTRVNNNDDGQSLSDVGIVQSSVQYCTWSFTRRPFSYGLRVDRFETSC